MDIATAALKWTLPFLLIAGRCTATNIPDDMDILESYFPNTLKGELTKDDVGFYEGSFPTDPFNYRTIQGKRETHDRVIQFPGLYSEFRPRETKILHAISKKRMKRNANLTKAPGTTKRPYITETSEGIPNAERRTMNASSEVIANHFVKRCGLLELPSKVIRKEVDSVAAGSTIMSEEIKLRAPKVNFITQQIKSPQLSKEMQYGKSEEVIRELYPRPIARTYYIRSPRDYDLHTASSQPPMIPRVNGKYDALPRNMIDRMYPPSPYQYDQYDHRRYDVDYDSYYPRYKFPYFYYFPDERYDVPRYYRYKNHIAEPGSHLDATYKLSLTPMSNPFTIGAGVRNRRIIYYTTLPEIVRRPTNIKDLHYQLDKHNRKRYDFFDTTRDPPTSSAYSDLRQTNDRDHREDKHVNSTPIKIVREAEAARNTPNEKWTTFGARSLDGKHYRKKQSAWRIVPEDTNVNLDRSVFRDGTSLFVSRSTYFGADH